jgi:hypothetical protein
MVGHALKRCAIEVLQLEGLRWVSLGLSPVAGIEDKEFTHNRLIRRGLRFAYTNWAFNRFIYPLQNHDLHKRQFDGIVEQTYFAFNTPPGLVRLFKVLRACGVF